MEVWLKEGGKAMRAEDEDEDEDEDKNGRGARKRRGSDGREGGLDKSSGIGVERMSKDTNEEKRRKSGKVLQRVKVR